MYAAQVIVNGVLLGGIYAVLGIGLSIILGIVKLTNLCHGEYVILGAYLTTVLTARLGLDPFVTLLISVPLMFILGFLLQYCLIDHAMKKGAEPALLVTFGLSIILKDAMLLVFGSDAQHITADYSNKTVSLFGTDVSVLNIVLMLLSTAVLLLLELFLKSTHLGRAVRAAADDREAAALSGINIDLIFSFAMGLAAATAAAAGFCVSMKWTFYAASGGHYLLTAFVVVVLGRLGDIRGTLGAGFVFGLIQVIGGANYGMLISYIFIIVILIMNQLKAHGMDGISER